MQVPVKQVLEGVEDLVETEPAVSAFGASRCSVSGAVVPAAPGAAFDLVQADSPATGDEGLLD